MELLKHILLNLDLVFIIIASLIAIVVMSKKIKDESKQAYCLQHRITSTKNKTR